MKVLVYGSEIVSSRIKPILDHSDVEIIAVTQKITEPRDIRVLRNLRDIDLAIVDAMEIGAKQVCNYLGKGRGIILALLVDRLKSDWEELRHYLAVAYIPKDTGDRELAARIKSVVSRAPSSGVTAEGSGSSKTISLTKV